MYVYASINSFQAIMPVMANFLGTYFIDPILNGTGYNIYNTITYALLLVFFVYLVYRMLKRLGILIDRKFFIGIVPFIALGGILRALEDYFAASGVNKALADSAIGGFIFSSQSGEFVNILLITPVIYFTIFLLAAASLLLSRKFMPGEYHKVWFASGAIVCLAATAMMRFTNYQAALLMAGITAIWAVLFIAAKKAAIMKGLNKLGEFFSKENTFLLSVHMFDATTTFTAIQFYPYTEQHVLPGFLIGIFGPAVMFALKLTVVAFVLYYTDKELNRKDDIEKRNFIKIAILVLGLAPGLRNFLRLVMGV